MPNARRLNHEIRHHRTPQHTDARRYMTLLGLVLALALMPGRVAQAYVPGAESCDRPTSALPGLSLVVVRTGRLAVGESTCFAVQLDRGELIRVAIDVETGYVRGRVLSPDGVELQRTWTSSFAFAAPSPMLTIEAPTAGTYIVELSVPTWVSFTGSQTFRVRLSSRESTAVRAARREDLGRDPRVDWLRTHARRIRTLDPDDTNFADLEFLRDALRDTRVVLLGEGDGGGGSDVLIRTRLVKFLHEQMGFDVIAFQAGIHSSSVAWRALQSDTNAREAVQMAMFGLLSRSVQADALIQYLAVRARSSRPIELTGFDSQLTGSAAGTLLPELWTFLRTRAPHSVLLDSSALPSRVLSGALDGRFSRDSARLPSVPEQAQAVELIRNEARSLERAPADDEVSFWAQVLRSTATQVDLMLDNVRGAAAGDYLAGLVRQLGDNLVWLVNRRYRDRKVIVWTHTFHAMHSPDATSYGRSVGRTVGQAVREALGDESFAIGLTSYDGTSHWVTQPEDYYQSIIPDQHFADAFETLMAAAGHQIAFVDLRGARARDEWIAGRIITNALYLVPEEAEWSKALDALLFVRTQEPRRRIVGAASRR